MKTSRPTGLTVIASLAMLTIFGMLLVVLAAIAERDRPSCFGHRLRRRRISVCRA